MSGFGTDVVALACIVGSAATSGAATLAFMDRGQADPEPCTVEAFAMAPNVVVSEGRGGHAIVMTAPRVHVHSAHDCRAMVGEEVRLNLEVMRREMERARVRIEVARTEAESARETARVIRIQGREAVLLREEALQQMEKAQAQMEEAMEQAGQARMEAVERALKEAQARMEAVKKGSGGQME